MRTRNCLAAPILAVVIATGIIDRVHSQTVDSTKVLAALQEQVWHPSAYQVAQCYHGIAVSSMLPAPGGGPGFNVASPLPEERKEAVDQ